MADLNQPIDPERIFYDYGQLFPDGFEFMVLYHLYSNYYSQEIQYAELKQAIDDTALLPFFKSEKNRQKERILKNLLHHFVERVPAKANYFVLTPHANKVIEIVTHRINNPYTKFPLRETFETYFTLPDNAKENIQALKSWFRFGFRNNAQQAVIGHLEGLKLEVDETIKGLNKILETDGLSALQLLEQFSNQFGVLGKNARQIADAIQMKVHVHYELRNIVDAYSKQVEMNLHANHGVYEESLINRNETIEIREEVNAFFEKIDQQLDLINNKMAFASYKIAELQESLRAQSMYKLNLKRMLAYLLENSEPDTQNWIKLPGEFPVRDLVRQKFRFNTIKYYDMGFLKKAQPVETYIDSIYEAEQRERIEKELAKQALILQYCEQAQADLDSTNELDLGKRIFSIMQEEDGLEIAVQMSYEFIRSLKPDTTVEITEEMQSDQTSSFHIWKTIIQNKNHSVS